MPGAYAGPSWADRRSTDAAVQATGAPSRTRREWTTPWITGLALVISVVLATLPIFLVPMFPARTLTLLLWALAVFIATAAVLKRLVPASSLVAASPSPRAERPLNVLGVLLACLTLYEISISRRPIPLWLWFCCAAIVAVMTIIALWSLPRDQRGRIAGTVYGMIVGLCILFPVMTMPRRFRGATSLVLTIVLLTTLVLMITAASRQRQASRDRTAP
ncbi:MAG TPA: hypothetical protein VGX97_05635 [bacterium]|nr:hypothetical protein [bacterium]